MGRKRRSGIEGQTEANTELAKAVEQEIAPSTLYAASEGLNTTSKMKKFFLQSVIDIGMRKLDRRDASAQLAQCKATLKVCEMETRYSGTGKAVNLQLSDEAFVTIPEPEQPEQPPQIMSVPMKEPAKEEPKEVIMPVEAKSFII